MALSVIVAFFTKLHRTEFFFQNVKLSIQYTPEKSYEYNMKSSKQTLGIKGHQNSTNNFNSNKLVVSHTVRIASQSVYSTSINVFHSKWVLRHGLQFHKCDHNGSPPSGPARRIASLNLLRRIKWYAY